MEFEKVETVPSANMTQEDMETIEKLGQMEIDEAAKTDVKPTKLKSLAKKLKGKSFRVYKREDATYVKRVEPKEKKKKEEEE